MMKMLFWIEGLEQWFRCIFKVIKYIFIVAAIFLVVITAKVSFEHIKMQRESGFDINVALKEVADKTINKKENSFLEYDFSKEPKGNRETFFGNEEQKEPVSIERMKEELDQAIDYLSLNEMADSISKDPSVVNILRNLLMETWRNGQLFLDEIKEYGNLSN